MLVHATTSVLFCAWMLKGYFDTIDDAARFTLPVALQRFVGEHKTKWGLFAAGALIVSAPGMGVFFALQRHLVGGLKG